MKKTFRSYAIVWGICLALFNVIAFAVPNDFKAHFWIGYLFITVAFTGQLFCAHQTFKAENNQKLFYTIPLITISYIGLLAMLFFGGLAMAVPIIPEWVGVIFCAAILGFTAVAVISANVAAEEIEKIDHMIKAKTVFIKMLTADAQILMNSTHEEPMLNQTKKIYEAIRYSDPMSCDALAPIESQITLKFNAFAQAVQTNSADAETLGNDLLILINDRNTRCKYLK